MSPFDRFRPKGLTKTVEEFVGSHEGVEGYLEPKTARFQQTLLLIDANGEWTRVPASDWRAAERVCRKLGVPFYDAAVVGYPERMRAKKPNDSPPAPSAEELEKWIMSDGEDDQGTNPSS